MSKRRRLALASLAAVLLGTACAEAGQGPTAPLQSEAPASSNLLGGLLGGVTGIIGDLLAPPINRTTPLPSDVTWSFTAGPGGAVSSNPAVGLTINIPSGALASTQTITVTALAGAPVAYRFEPHLEFGKKVYLTQNLTGTSAGLLSVLSGAHFEGETVALNPDGLAIVSEIVPGVISVLTRKFTFGVTHFSGWIVVSGRGSEAEESGSN